MQFSSLCLIAFFALCSAQDPAPPATTPPFIIDPTTNTPLFIPGLSPPAPQESTPPLPPPTTPEPHPVTDPTTNFNNSFLPPPPVFTPPSNTNSSLPPPPVFPSNNSTNSNSSETTENSINVKSKGLLLTADALLDPDLEALVRAVRQVFIRANRTSFNVSEAKVGSLAGVNADLHVGTDGKATNAKRFIFSIDNNFLATNKVKMDNHTNRMEQSLNITYLRPLVDRLNKSGLFNRAMNLVPDAHANVITAAEFARLSSIGITIEELRVIGNQNYLAYTQMNFICMGRQSKLINGVNEEIVFIRTTAKEWTMVRADVAKLVAQKTSNTTIFDPKSYHPHIAVAWTGGYQWTDDEIGAADQRCFAEIALVDPKAKKRTNAIVAPVDNLNAMPVQPNWSASATKKVETVVENSASNLLSKVSLVDAELLEEDTQQARVRGQGRHQNNRWTS